MLKGKTESGFEYVVSDENLNNFELLEALSEVETNPLVVARLLTLLLGTEQKQALMDHLRTDSGVVPTDAVTTELAEILKGGQAKNS